MICRVVSTRQKWVLSNLNRNVSFLQREPVDGVALSVCAIDAVKASGADSAVQSCMRASTTKRVVRSTSTPTADWLALPYWTWSVITVSVSINNAR